jgi:hypothetical protein
VTPPARARISISSSEAAIAATIPATHAISPRPHRAAARAVMLAVGAVTTPPIVRVAGLPIQVETRRL